MTSPESDTLEPVTLYTAPEAVYTYIDKTVVPSRVTTGWFSVIVALESPSIGSLEQERFPDLPPADRVWELEVLSRIAGRLGVAYQCIMFHKPPWPYECAGLTAFTEGAERDILPLSLQTSKQVLGEPVRPGDLKAGRPYTFTDSGEPRHMLLGLGSSTRRNRAHNLSIPGLNGPLAVARTVNAMTTYGADEIRPVTYIGHD